MAYTEEEIKVAYWKTFHRAGELWFDYIGNDEACEESTKCHWGDFIDNLRGSVTPIK